MYIFLIESCPSNHTITHIYVFMLFITQNFAGKDNLISSAIAELVDFIRIENIRLVADYIVVSKLFGLLQ